jgi:hypothetical protein
MRTYSGRVAELQLDPAGQTAARIACPPGAVPAPGQYLLATDETSLLGIPLFNAGPALNGFLAAPPLPASWAPGTPLALRGPLGRGFRLPAGLRRLALIAASHGIVGHEVAGNGVAGYGIARLLPLAIQALEGNAAVTLFAAGPLPDLPLSVEAYPLEAAAEAARWADFLAVEIPLEELPGLGTLLGLGPGERPSIPGQALIVAAMPCAGLADCGVCAVLTGGRSWKMACKDGPVFDLKDLLT